MTSSSSLPVARTLENGFSIVATGRHKHMIKGAGNFYPQRTGHFHASRLPTLHHLESTYSIHSIIFQFSRPYASLLIGKSKIDPNS